MMADKTFKLDSDPRGVSASSRGYHIRMNVREVQAIASCNVKIPPSLEEARDMLQKINWIIFEQSALETALEDPEDAERIRAYGYKRIAEVLGIEI
jgi:hypothetical protein